VNNPVCYYDPTGNWPTLADVTRTIARGLIANPVSVYITQHPDQFNMQLPWPFSGSISAVDVFYAAGFNWDKSTGVYHARQDALQQYGGYNFVYEIMFDYATSMKPAIFQFTHNSQELGTH
jgi:hypothetical protein